MKLSHVFLAYLFSLISGSLILSLPSEGDIFVLCLLFSLIHSLPFLAVFLISNHFLKKRGKGFAQVQLVHVAITLVYVAIYIIFWSQMGSKITNSAFILLPYFISGVGFQAAFYFGSRKALNAS